MSSVAGASQQPAPMGPREHEDDPFEIKQQVRAAPRPRPGLASSIVEFYAGRSVLITGASGFIGKVLIEKLLRTCPDIKRIFLLIRPKHDKKPQERLRAILDSLLFEDLRAEAERKVSVVQGDVTQPQLGLSSYDQARIVREVTVIFHSAATVKFDEPLKQSVAINMAGTRNMIELCRRIPRLAGLVHVSTAYANCDRPAVDEHIYPVETDPERLLELADWLDQDTLQELKRRLLGEKPNTYTYTKSLAEWLLVRTARDLPVVICRPSIVVATASEPFSGWIDNMNGPTGIVLGAGKGLVRSMYAENDFVADLVPADKVISLIASLGWFAHVSTAHRKQTSGGAGVGLDESLSEFVGSSVCSSGAGSSAASTSGVDDSLQEEDSLQSEGQSDGDGHAHQLDDEASSSPEDESTDLSIASSSSGSSERAESRGGSPDESGPYSLQQQQCAKQQPAAGDHLSARRRRQQQQRRLHHDDGYAGRCSRYANSITSSDSALSLSDQSGCRADERPAGPRASPTSETRRAAPQQRDTLRENRDEHFTPPAGPHLHPHSDHHHQHPHQGPGGEQLAAKLASFRARNVAKLADKGLPEELADVPVFHCTSGGENPITWGRVQMLILTALAVFPMSSVYRYPRGTFTNWESLDNFYKLTLHYLPAYIVDCVARLTGGKAQVVKLFRKFDQAAGVLRAFTSNQWAFGYENRLFLFEGLMSAEDRRLFNFDIRPLDWDQYCTDYVIGVRKFLLKEPMSNLAEARRSLRRVYCRNLCLQLVCAAAAGYWAAAWTGLLA